MGENILANHKILVPHLELTKPQPKRHEICGHYHTDILYLYGNPTIKHIKIFYLSAEFYQHKIHSIL